MSSLLYLTTAISRLTTRPAWLRYSPSVIKKHVYIPAVANDAEVTTAQRSAVASHRTIEENNKEWLVILPDKPGSAPLRTNLRPQHLADLTAIYPTNFILMGGPWLREPAEEGHSTEMQGSVVLAQAPSAAAVMSLLKRDIFTREGVWDWSKVQIVPFQSTIRRALASD